MLNLVLRQNLYHFKAIQIQQLLMLNDNGGIINESGNVIQIQQLLMLNSSNFLTTPCIKFIQIQQLLMLNLAIISM